MSVTPSNNRAPRTRIVTVGTRRLVAVGLDANPWRDLYHHAMTARWPLFFGGVALLFLAVNTIFAIVYWLGQDPVANTRPGSFLDLFFFSIETLATVGYGDMHPQTTYGHVVATIEIFTGMSGIAVVTGLVFSRFSRPRARILFADNLVIGQHDGKSTLMVRIANERHNSITDATAKLWLVRLELTQEGGRFRRVHELKLQRAQNPIFALSWTLFHSIDETSLLWGADADELARTEAGFIVTFSGLDESSGQEVHARRAYDYESVSFGREYEDILGVNDDGVSMIDYTKFHSTRPQAPASS